MSEWRYWAGWDEVVHTPEDNTYEKRGDPNFWPAYVTLRKFEQNEKGEKRLLSEEKYVRLQTMLE